MHSVPDPDALRRNFETKVDTSSGQGPEGACHTWSASKVGPAGYGQMRIPGTRRNALAHRVVFFLAHGRWPDNAMHTCDNPSCVRREHIVEGTHDDNMRDMVRKGRAARRSNGRHAGPVKLTCEQVAQIRSACGTQTQIAAAFGVSQPYVSMVRAGHRRTA